MTPDDFMVFMDQYGLLFLFGIVLLEYLNLPGFPAGVIFPVTGVWLSTTDISFMAALGVSVAAALIGSYVLYVIGKKGGPPLIERIKKKRPSVAEKIDRYSEKLKAHANATIFFSKLLPVIRTLIGFPAGAVGIKLRNYLFFSALGITIWNSALMLVGVFFGDLVFSS